MVEPSDFKTQYHQLRDEISKVIVGHDIIKDHVLLCLFAGGNVLLEGVPGIGKTQFVKTLSQALSLTFSRIQFTPDLMPADILGMRMIHENAEGGRSLVFQPGPIFSQIVLADEINRAAPKTQSALLEAMQEHTVTVGNDTYSLSEPFFVIATQNPIEHEGTYPLPEAQLDRFMMKLNFSLPSQEELVEIMNRTTEGFNASIKTVLNASMINDFRELIRNVIAAPPIKNYVARLIISSHPESEYASKYSKKYVRYGSSPRGCQSILLTAKVLALTEGRYHVSYADVMSVAKPCLRHRLLRNFDGETEDISTDKIIEDILSSTPREG